jgi:hypothetical protein
MNGAQAIQIAEIMAFCAMAGLADPVTRMTILNMVQAMDDEFLSVMAERRKAKG